MDEELVRRAKDGDPGAFRALAIEQHPRLFAAAYGILRDRDLAQDATQQTLVNVWRHFHGLRDPGRFEGWSYRILVHACYAEAKAKPTLLADDEATVREPARATSSSASTTATSSSGRSAACRSSTGPWSCSTTSPTCRSTPSLKRST